MRPVRAIRLHVAAVLLLAIAGGAAQASEGEVRAALDGFLRAFENGDLETMEAAFASDASTFPRAIMANGLDTEIDVAAYRRVTGIDPQMRAVVERLKAEGSGPPYMKLEPADLRIQLFADVAVVTFHLEGAWLGRRTIVMARKDDAWKIVHLHASNVQAFAPR